VCKDKTKPNQTSHNFLELKTLFSTTTTKPVYVLKERVVTGETQISGLEEQVEKIFQSTEQII
jgi:hypothetical protein